MQRWNLFFKPEFMGKLTSGWGTIGLHGEVEKGAEEFSPGMTLGNGKKIVEQYTL